MCNTQIYVIIDVASSIIVITLEYHNGNIWLTWAENGLPGKYETFSQSSEGTLQPNHQDCPFSPNLQVGGSTLNHSWYLVSKFVHAGNAPDIRKRNKHILDFNLFKKMWRKRRFKHWEFVRVFQEDICPGAWCVSCRGRFIRPHEWCHVCWCTQSVEGLLHCTGSP